MKNNLTVIVLTHNEEENIIDCLESVIFANEVIVIDDNSTDRTKELAESLKVKVLTRNLNGNFSNQRNFALNLAHNSWVLFIDADERVTPLLQNEILHVISTKNTEGYFLKRSDYMWGKRMKYGEAGSVKLLRLAKKDSGKWGGKVHETWKIAGNIGELNEPLIHIPHPSVREFVKEIDEYSTMRAQELYDLGKKSSFVTIFLYPTAKFIVNYFIKRGYKDKIPGFVYAMLMSLHSFLVRAKLYLYTSKV